MTAANDPAAAPQPSSTPESTPSAVPDSNTAIQEGSPPVAGERIPLPPPPTPSWSQTMPQQLASELARLDRLLVLGVLAFAFLLASFAVRNSDFWMHLATGRLIAQGNYQFGVDPFSYAATPYWTNHAWLLDLLWYGLARLTGGVQTPLSGAVLVVLKALLVTALAGILLQIRRPGQGLWVQSVCVGLAILTLSPRLLLQPMLVSLLFLGLTLYLLTRKPAPDHPGANPRWRVGLSARGISPLWALPPLFALWVNLDNWFLLGPVTVALYLLGQVLQQVLAPIRTGAEAPEPGETRTLVLVLIVGVAACLINPHHYHAFTLPAELYSDTINTIRERDERLLTYRISPWTPEYFRPNQGWSLAGLAYFPLVALGLAAFGLNLRGWRWWRAVLWLAFLLLSAYQARCIGFFAIVAGPITALNLQDFAARRLGSAGYLDRPWRAWALGGRIVTLLALGVLLVATWPGWLHVYPEHPRLTRRVAWAVEADTSLQQAAEQLQTWRREGLLRDNEHGFNYLWDVAAYCAWFCPDEKSFVDFRFPLFGGSASTFVDVRHALRGDPLNQLTGQSRRSADWRQVFHDNQINHVILNNSYDADAAPALRWLLRDWQQWAVLYMDGQTTILAWNDPARPRRAESPQIARVNLTQWAFGPNPPQQHRAPAEGPGYPHRREPWSRLWNQFLNGPVPRPVEVDEAQRYLEYFETMAPQWPGYYLGSWHVATWSGILAANGSSPGSVSGPGILSLSTLFFFNPSLLLRYKDSGPPAAPLLAVRAARRALAASPDYHQAYVALAQAYTYLSSAQEEPWSGQAQAMPNAPRQVLRHIQLISAWQHVLTLRPETEEAHMFLARMFGQVNFLDLALEQMRDGLKSMRGSPRHPGESLEQFSKRLEEIQGRIKELDHEVQKRRNDYELRAANQQLLGKTNLALERGLAKRALDTLLEADVSQMGAEEANVQLWLLLMTGRLEDVRERLTPELKAVLGSDYEWYNALLAAASGHYQQAGEYVDKLIADLEKTSAESALTLVRGQTFQGIMGPLSLSNLSGIVNSLRQLADDRALRGLLALEEGDTATAAQYFQKALETSGEGNEAMFYFDSRAISHHYLQLLRAAAK